ncbi:MAG: hypothetical protein WB992_05135 [Bryobacteraceae bacterium]
MHGSIRDGLEDLLSGESSPGKSEAASTHLSSCAECSSEFQSMKAQSGLFKTLRAPEEIEPTAGFYARVIQRIEERTKDSIWAGFIYSSFGNRLAYATLTIALLLGSYVITQESRDGHLGGPPVIAANSHYDALVIGSQAEQRDAVLENFASHHFTSDQAAADQGSPQ